MQFQSPQPHLELWVLSQALKLFADSRFHYYYGSRCLHAPNITILQDERLRLLGCRAPAIFTLEVGSLQATCLSR